MDTISLTLIKIIPNEFFKYSKFKWEKKITEKHRVIWNLTLSNCKLTYFTKHSTVKLTFSATKLIYGNNLQDFDLKDMNLLRNTIMNIIEEVFHSIIKDPIYWHINNWNITRLDLVTNICFKNNTDKKIFIELLKKLNYSYCKKDIYQSSSHSHNRSITYNFYDKNEEIENSKDRYLYPPNIPNTLRLEIQFKNNSIYRFCKKNNIDHKNFGYFSSLPSLLNQIYKDSLRRIGLDKKFLTKKEMSKLLKKIYKNKEISKKTFNNMYNYFINESITISKNTLLTYKKILSNYNCSHILLDRKVNKKINFMSLLLFKSTNIFLSFKKKFKNLHCVLMNNIIYLIINLKTIIKIYNDS